MLSANPFSSRFITTAFVAAAIAAFGLSVRAQDNASHQTPYVDDWSHHHMVFSNPGTRDDAVKNNKLDQWQKVNNDLRYQLQQGKRNVGTRPVVVDGSDRNGNDHSRDGSKDHGKGAKPGKGTASDLTRDWSQVLGGGTSVIGTVTSLTSGNITGGTSGVSMDGVTFLASPPTPETQTGVISGGTPGGTIVIKNSTGPNTLTLSAAGGGGLTRQNASFSGDPTAGSTITVGSRTYTWVSGAATSANQITSGTGGANDNAQNFYAALLGNPAECYDAGVSLLLRPSTPRLLVYGPVTAVILLSPSITQPQALSISPPQAVSSLSPAGVPSPPQRAQQTAVVVHRPEHSSTRA